MHFQFTWRDVDRVRTYREGQGKALLGWYHTHPDFGVFLSETDLEKTHRVLFSEPSRSPSSTIRCARGRVISSGRAPQRIDASQADWREFDIAFTEGPSDGPAADSPTLPPVARPPGPVEPPTLPPGAASPHTRVEGQGA